MHAWHAPTFTLPVLGDGWSPMICMQGHGQQSSLTRRLAQCGAATWRHLHFPPLSWSSGGGGGGGGGFCPRASSK